MKQESNKRLYFTNDFSPENVAELQAQGYTLRKASAYHEADTLEACAEVAGDVPQAYLDLIKRNKANIVTANVQVSITPELQKVIDDAKAECEKVVAKNAELKQQVETLKAGLIQGEPADLTGLVPVEQFDAVALDLTNTKEQLATAQGELISFKNDVGAMQARIAELQSVDYSKLKVDELKDVLKLKGIEFSSDAKKDDLLALLAPKE